MKFLQFIKSNLLFSLIIFFLVIVPLTVIPIYFAINKPSSSSELEAELAEAEAEAETPYVSPTKNPNELGFVYISTINHVDSPKKFASLNLIIYSSFGWDVDTGIVDPVYNIQHKWFYDKNNTYTIERKILNTDNHYSQEELSALGKTNKPNTYVVNQIIAIYDKNEPNLSKDVNMYIHPMILTTYANFENMTK